jgi:hypothetical protein
MEVYMSTYTLEFAQTQEGLDEIARSALTVLESLGLGKDRGKGSDSGAFKDGAAVLHSELPPGDWLGPVLW